MLRIPLQDLARPYHQRRGFPPPFLLKGRNSRVNKMQHRTKNKHYFLLIRDVYFQRPGHGSAYAVLLLPVPSFVGPLPILVRCFLSLRSSPVRAYL